MIAPTATSYALLRKQGRNIRLHGNGFVQLDLPDDQRVHVWGSEGLIGLPRQRVSTQIHDHRFSFTSRIVIGALENREYCVVFKPEGVYQVYVVSPRERADTELAATGKLCDVESDSEVEDGFPVYRPGCPYVMEVGNFHESVPHELSMTIMTKVCTYHAHRPRVLVPVGQDPDNEFDRYSAVPEGDLWLAVRLACDKLEAYRLEHGIQAYV